jgi:hypothetical protein
MKLQLVPVLIAMLVRAAQAHPIAGDYIRVGSNNVVSSRLRVEAVRPGEVRISLDAESHPDPSVAYARTGSLEEQVVPLTGDIALHREFEGEDLGCSIVFAFKAGEVEVAQFGRCAAFGAGIDVSGRYLPPKRPRKGQTG